MKIFWTDTAVEHLSAIYSYIAQNSPQYAQQIIDRITRRSQQIADFPLSGRVVREFTTKQIREVIEGSYRIIYYIKPEQIEVLAVLHGKQQVKSVVDGDE